MAKSDNKATATNVDPMDFIAAVEHDVRRADAYRLVDIHREETGEEPYMYGPSIVGFGNYHYVYESGREGDAPAAGFSPRKPQTVVYLVEGYEDIYPDLLDRLGPYKLGKSCLYIKKLADIDEPVLRQMIRDSYQRVKAAYPDS